MYLLRARARLCSEQRNPGTIEADLEYRYSPWATAALLQMRRDLEIHKVSTSAAPGKKTEMALPHPSVVSDETRI